MPGRKENVVPKGKKVCTNQEQDSPLSKRQFDDLEKRHNLASELAELIRIMVKPDFQEDVTVSLEDNFSDIRCAMTYKHDEKKCSDEDRMVE